MSELPSAIWAVERLQYGLSEKWSCGIGVIVGQLRGGLICTHVGGLPVLTLFVRHSARPQASMRPWLFGSSRKYGAKLKLRSVVVAPRMSAQLTPALLLRCAPKCW